MWRHAAGIVVVLASFPGSGDGAQPAWPPAPETQGRIEILRRTLGDASVTPAQRQAARDELARLLMPPGARGGPAAAPMAPRAAIDVTAPARPPVPATLAIPPVTPVAPPVRPPDPIPDGKGGIVVPAGNNAVDPRTGSLLLDVGNGYLDPATGRFVPKP